MVALRREAMDAQQVLANVGLCRLLLLLEPVFLIGHEYSLGKCQY